MGRRSLTVAAILVTTGFTGAVTLQAAEEGYPAPAAHSDAGITLRQIMSDPNARLLMAHRRTLIFFGTMLRNEVKKSDRSLEKEFARAAVAEMRHSLAEMKKVNERQLGVVEVGTRQADDGCVVTGAGLASLSARLDAIEGELRETHPDRSAMEKELEYFFNDCDAMSPLIIREGTGPAPQR